MIGAVAHAVVLLGAGGNGLACLQAGGQFVGRTQPARACTCWRLPVRASVSPGQGLCAGYSNAAGVHGREKVYGSIP
jgi:hypothetical protein